MAAERMRYKANNFALLEEVKVKGKVAQSCRTLYKPMDHTSMEFSKPE